MAAITKAQLVQALAEVWSDMKPAMDPPSTPPRSNKTDRLPAACKKKRQNKTKKKKKKKEMKKRTISSTDQPKGMFICTNHGNIVVCTASCSTAATWLFGSTLACLSLPEGQVQVHLAVAQCRAGGRVQKLHGHKEVDKASCSIPRMTQKCLRISPVQIV